MNSCLLEENPIMFANLFIIFTGVLGFIILFIILFGYKSNRLVNIYIALIILFSSLRFLLIGLKDLTKSDYINDFFYYNNTSFIFIAPFFYLYFKNLISSQKNFVVKDLFHFIFPVLLIFTNRISIVKNQLNIISPFILLYIFILYAIVYDVLIFIKLKKDIWYKKSSLKIIAKQNLLIRKWSIYLYITYNLIFLRLIISVLLETKKVNVISGQYGIWIASIVWFFIFMKILTSPEILFGYFLLHKKSEENKKFTSTKISRWKIVCKEKITNVQDLQLCDKINPSIEKYINDVETILDQNIFFRDPKFSVPDFAIKLNIPKSHLTYLFKYHSEISFSDYKKIARIEDALNLIQHDYLKINTYDSLAREVGFSSYNPFLTSFKDVLGMTPQQYIDNLYKNKISI